MERRPAHLGMRWQAAATSIAQVTPPPKPSIGP
jgi:hypothetical protein